jgi:hypothetical protein
MGVVLLSILFTSPLAVPSCLTPMVQHFAGGWEVIVLGLDVGIDQKIVELDVE